MLKQLRRLIDPPADNGECGRALRGAIEDLRTETAKAEHLLNTVRIESKRRETRARYHPPRR